MTSTSRAHVALVVGRLIGGRAAGGVFDRGAGRRLDLREMDERMKLIRYEEGKANCGMVRSPDGTPWCLVDERGGRHVCLSLYGRLFDGYDSDSASHFSGFVDDDGVSLYDYGASDFFDYRI